MKYVSFFIVLLFCLGIRAETAVYFTPSNDCENIIIKLLNNAKKDVDIAVYSINNKNISAALYAAKERGIPIRILTDRLQAAGKGAKALEFYLAGFDIRVHSKHRIEHNKFMIVDGESVVTGSFNWTNPASLKNSENCLLIWRDPMTVTKYKKRFEYLWSVNSNEKSTTWFKQKKLEEEQKACLSGETPL